MGIQGGEEIVYVGGLLQLTVKDYRKQKKNISKDKSTEERPVVICLV